METDTIRIGEVVSIYLVACTCRVVFDDDDSLNSTTCRSCRGARMTITTISFRTLVKMLWSHFDVEVKRTVLFSALSTRVRLRRLSPVLRSERLFSRTGRDSATTEKRTS